MPTWISLDALLKAVQIAFYVVAGTVAVLTYRSARRGLLNSVNTEYKKRVMDRLAKLSEQIFAEFDASSEHHWIKKKSAATEAVELIHEDFLSDEPENFYDGEFHGGIPVADEQARQAQFIESVKTDPFIPEHIREEVVQFFQRRLDAYRSASIEILEQYCHDLAAGKYKPDDDNKHWIHNEINSRLYAEDVGIGQAQNRVHELRLLIQKYMESFDPIPYRRPRQSADLPATSATKPRRARIVASTEARAKPRIEAQEHPETELPVADQSHEIQSESPRTTENV